MGYLSLYDALRDALLRDHEDTLRDQFAMAALSGVISDTKRFGFSHVCIAEEAYMLADALMERRKK